MVGTLPFTWGGGGGGGDAGKLHESCGAGDFQDFRGPNTSEGSIFFRVEADVFFRSLPEYLRFYQFSQVSLLNSTAKNNSVDLPVKLKVS